MGAARVMIRDGRMMMLDPGDVMSPSTVAAVHALVAEGLPKQHAATKLGINKPLLKQINKVAEKYIAYYTESEDIYLEKIGRNSDKNREFVENCIAFYIACERAEAEFASTVVKSIMRGVEESPELALKVAERRFSDDWGQKRETNVNIDTKSVIKTIEIKLPSYEIVEEAEYEEVE